MSDIFNNTKKEALDINEILVSQADSSERFPITIWVSRPVKEKYDKLQIITKKKFSRKLKEFLSDSISSIPVSF